MRMLVPALTKMRSLGAFAIASILLLAASGVSAQALEEHHVNFSAGGGFTTPVEATGSALDTGWNINFRGGASVADQLLLDLDFTYAHSRFSNGTLARFGEPDGGVGIWSLTFNPGIRLAPSSSKVQPYVTGGYGLYHLNFEVSHPTTVPTIVCDAFFGFCAPALVGTNQVVASNSTYRAGFNGGAGLEFRLGDSKTKLFAEARYHQMFMAHTEDVSYVPVTFGVRW